MPLIVSLSPIPPAASKRIWRKLKEVGWYYAPPPASSLSTASGWFIKAGKERKNRHKFIVGKDYLVS